MDRLITSAVIVFCLPLYLAWRVFRTKLRPHRLRLPPGPEGIPILGNALQINKKEPWLTYGKWKKMYGEIVSCELLGQTYIILNSSRIANALLEQRSTIYSDRPLTRTSELFGLEFSTGHLSYGETWEFHRKVFHQTLGNASIPKYHDALIERSHDLFRNLLRSPEAFRSHTRTYAVSVVMSITYGYNVLPKDDSFVTPLDEVLNIAVLTTPERAILFNIFPRLGYIPTWFPGAELQRLAARSRQLSSKVRDAPFRFVKDCLATNVENDSMVAQLLKDDTMPAENRAEYEQNIKDCATSAFIAGTDTTRATLDTLIMVLVLFPEVQERAQALIDKVVGRDRLPDFNDRPALTYIDALLWEIMRWASLVPMGVPHTVKQDDVFEQRLIPKGSVIIPNVWEMSRDKEGFPDPEVVKPERYLDANGNLVADDLTGLVFGFGRRICPGRHLAHTSNWIAVAGMLSMFTFGKEIGPAGYPTEVFPIFTGGVVRRPVSFRCSITPRFKEAEAFMRMVAGPPHSKDD